jgi:hypothetical protein
MQTENQALNQGKMLSEECVEESNKKDDCKGEERAMPSLIYIVGMI